MKKYFLIILFVFLAFTVSCQEKPVPTKSPELNFLVDFLPADEKTIDIVFSVQSSNSDLAADNEFNANMMLTGPDNEKRASFIINQLPAMKSNESLEMVNWHGQLDPGQYKLVWGADGYSKLETTFEVALTPGGVLEVKNQKILSDNPS